LTEDGNIEALNDYRKTKVATTLLELEAPEIHQTNLLDLAFSCLHADPTQRPPTVDEIARRLKHLLIDVVLFDSAGNTFWKTNFLSRVEVPFMEFMELFEKSFEIDKIKNQDTHYQVKLDAFQFLLSSGNVPVQGTQLVKLDNFSKMLCWFGPIDATEPNNAYNLLRRIEEQLGKRSFFGAIEASQAEAMLKDELEGTYLVRFSGSIPGSYTVSARVNMLKSNNRKVCHFRIYHKPGGKYYCNKEYSGHGYDTLEKTLLEISNNKQNNFQLVRPVMTPTPYEKIFAIHNNSNSYQRPQYYSFDEKDEKEKVLPVNCFGYY